MERQMFNTALDVIRKMVDADRKISQAIDSTTDALMEMGEELGISRPQVHDLIYRVDGTTQQEM